MSKLKLILIPIIVTIATFYLLTVFNQQSNTAIESSNKETAFDRTIDSQTLRCGYATWYPGFFIDSVTGNKSGYAYDITMAMAKRLGLDIEWVEETGWGNAETGIIHGRYDAVCAHVCIEAQRMKSASFSRPFYHEPIYVMSRADDPRFKQSLDRLNNENMKIAVLPGSIFETMARTYFPKAEALDISQLGAETDLFLSVLTKKADASFNTGISITNYNKSNNSVVKRSEEPIDYCSAGFMLPAQDMQLKQMVDTALEEMLMSGEVDRIISQYVEPDPTLWTPAKPAFKPVN